MIQQFDSSAPEFAEFVEFSERLHSGDALWQKPALPRGEIENGRFFLSTDKAGKTLARLYANTKFELDWRGRNLGIIGLYDAAEDIRRGLVQELLDSACHYLHLRGCDYVVGPMNGSTWYNYRFALSDSNCPFFLDNRQPANYLAQWLAAGFAPEENYLSYAIERESFQFDRLDRFRTHLARRKIRLEDIRPDKFETVLPEIHRLSMAAFVNSPFYSPLPLEDFMDLYRPLQPLLQPRRQVLARNRAGELLGFIFTVPDSIEQQRSALVIKTVAVAPAPEARGLGAGLTVLLHHRAWQDGCQRIYHALMHCKNGSTLINAAGARIHRRYVLLGRPLTGALL